MSIIDRLIKKAKELLHSNITDDNKTLTTQLPSPARNGKITFHTMGVGLNNIKDLAHDFYVIDVETTGLDNLSDRIVEIGIARFIDGKIMGTFSSLLNAGKTISPQASAINGISNSMIANAPKESYVVKEVVKFLGDSLFNKTPIVAHNARFDMKFLYSMFFRHGIDAEIRCLDTLSISRDLINLKSYKLSSLATHYAIKETADHRALSDAIVCGKVFLKLLESANGYLEKKEAQAKARELAKTEEKPSQEQYSIVAVILDIIKSKYPSVDWLGARRTKYGELCISYLYDIIRIHSNKNGRYIIVKKIFIPDDYAFIEPCSASEGGSENIRFYFGNPNKLRLLSDYILMLFKDAYSAYKSVSKKYIKDYEDGAAYYNRLIGEEVSSTLQSIDSYNYDSLLPRIDDLKKPMDIKEFKITPTIEIKPLKSITRVTNEQYLYKEIEEADKTRKQGNIDKALTQLIRVRESGYLSYELYLQLAKCLRSQKLYDDEIFILNEGIKILRQERNQWSRERSSQLEARRNSVLELKIRTIEKQKIQREKEKMSAQRKAEKAKLLAEKQAQREASKRIILQISNAGAIIAEYDTIAAASQAVGVDSKCIRDALCGKQKHAGGYIWKVKE